MANVILPASFRNIIDNKLSLNESPSKQEVTLSSSENISENKRSNAMRNVMARYLRAWPSINLWEINVIYNSYLAAAYFSAATSHERQKISAWRKYASSRKREIFTSPIYGMHALIIKRRIPYRLLEKLYCAAWRALLAGRRGEAQGYGYRNSASLISIRCESWKLK